MKYVKIYDEKVQPCGVKEFQQDEILDLIPQSATPQNNLVDFNTMTQAIATSTGTFRGTYETLVELQAVENVENNDYGYVESVDLAGNNIYKRYKYNGNEWLYEFTLSNLTFTQPEWNAIKSGITSELVEKLVQLPDADEVAVVSQLNNG